MLGRIHSEKNARIHYCLTVARRGAATEATLAEIGDVYVSANTPTEFGHTRLPRYDGIDLDAHLIITWADGQIECDLVPPLP